MLEYQDFELEISSRSPFEFFGKVLSSPGGQSERCRLNFAFAANATTFENQILKIENAVLRGQDLGRRGPLSEPERVLQGFGRDLFRGIFVEPGSIRDAYARSKGALATDGQKSLRIKLRIDSPELASLPWEYLYDPDETPSYISLRVPLVRSLDMLGVPGQMQVKGPLRILGMIANPGTPEWPRLDEAQERRRIGRGIDKLQREGRIIFEWVGGGTGANLLSKLVESEWHIFHFIGHGGVDPPSDDQSGDETTDGSGYIVLIDESGQPVKKYTSDLAILLSSPYRSLRLAVLNCCESGKANDRDRLSSPAVALIRSGLPAVVAMQFPFTDTAAINLSQGFYQALANNLPVDGAITFARQFIQNDSNIEWAIPVLYMRAADGRIFQVDNSGGGVASEALVDTPATASDHGGARKAVASIDAKLAEFTQLYAVPEKSDEDLEKMVRLGRELVDRKGDHLLSVELAQAYYEIGLRQLRKIDLLRASANLSRAIDLDRDQPDYRICRANFYTRVGLYESALSDIAEAIRLRPDNPEYHWIRGIVYSMSAGRDESPGLLKEAITAFDRAVKLNSQEAKYFASRADALAKAKRMSEAVSDLDRAISLAPNNPDYVAQRVKLAQEPAANI
jgi:tetratricopeptide (TPR) repeat protein